MRKAAALVLVLFLFFSIFSFNTLAAADFDIYFGGAAVTNGIIHYQGDTATIGIQSTINGFTVYMNGSVLGTYAGTYAEYTLNMPGGVYQFYISSSSGNSSYKTINFYHDTNASEGATFTYASYEVAVNGINGVALPVVEAISYIGEVLNQEAVDALFSKYKSLANLTPGQQYDLFGWVRIRVFDSTSSPVGDYDCLNGLSAGGYAIYSNLFDSRFGWPSSTLNDFYSRDSWSATKPFINDTAPTPTPDATQTPAPSTSPSPTATPSSAPTTTASPRPNSPPVALISVDRSVKAGEDLFVNGSYSYDPDGSITGYFWNTPNAQGSLNGVSGTIWYPEKGTFNIGLTVADNGGSIGSTSADITVIDPYPEAIISITGTLKANRKITIKSDSKSPSHYPIVNSAWAITRSDGSTSTEVRYSGSLTGVTSKDILFKTPGTYKVALTVTNSKGLSSSSEKTIIVVPDAAPDANFTTISTVLRNPADANRAAITVNDASVSNDSDIISQRVWTYRYDSDNDGDYNDEAVVTVDSGNLTTITVKPDKVGKYQFDLAVKESFGHATIEGFIADTDYKTANTRFNANRVVEVINTAPVADFTVIPKKYAEVEIQYDSSSGLTEDSVQSYINSGILPVMASNSIDINITSKYVETGVSVDKAYPQGEVLLKPANNPFAYGEVGAYVTGEYLIEYQNGSFVVFDYFTGAEVKRYSIAALSGYSQADLKAFAHSKDSSLIYFYGNYRTTALRPGVGYSWVSYKRVICVDFLTGIISWSTDIAQVWDSSGVYTAFDSFRSGILDSNSIYIETSGSNNYGISTINPSTGAIVSQYSYTLPSGHIYVGVHHQTYGIYTYYVSGAGAYTNDTVHLQAYDMRNGSCIFYKPYSVLKGGHKYFVMLNKEGLYLVIVPRVPYIDDYGYDRRFVYSAVFDLTGNIIKQYNFNPPWGQWYAYFSVGKTDKYLALQMYDYGSGIYRQTHVINYTNGSVSNLPNEQGDFNVSDSLITHMGDWIYVYRNYDDRSYFLISFNTATNAYTRSYYNNMTFQVVSKEYGVLRHGVAPWALDNYSFIKLALLKKEPGYNSKTTWSKNSKHYSVYISSKPILDNALNSTNLKNLVNNNAAFAGMGTAQNKLQMNNYISSNANNGIFIDNANMSSAFTNLSNYIVDTLESNAVSDSTYVIAGSVFNTNVIYSDRENDPKYLEKWVYEHTPDYFENSNGKIADNGLVRQTPYTVFDKVGKYDVTCQVRDNPLNSVKFDSYRLWSLPDAGGKAIFVHRAPIANLSFSITGMSGSNYIPAFTNLSYDLDHISLVNKGIQAVEAKWQIYKEGTWHNGFPELLLPNTIYSVMIKVRDIDGPLGIGAWSEPFMLLIDTSSFSTVPHPPVISADPESTAWANSAYVSITVTDAYGDYKETYFAWSDSTQLPSAGWSSSLLPGFGVSNSNNGVYYLHIRAVDEAGYSSYKRAGPYRIDNIPPVITAIPENADKLGTSIDVEINVSDIGGSGFKELSYTWSLSSEKPIAGWKTSLNQQVISSQKEVGSWYLHVSAKDNAGNISDKVFGVYRLRKPVVDIMFTAVNSDNLSTIVPAGDTIMLISDDNSKGVKILSDTEILSASAMFNDTKIGDLTINTPVFKDGKYLYYSDVVHYMLPAETRDGVYTIRVDAVAKFGSVHTNTAQITVRTPIDLSIEVENTAEKKIYNTETNVTTEFGSFNSVLSQYSKNIIRAFASEYVNNVTLNFYTHDNLIGSVEMYKDNAEQFWLWESLIQEDFFEGVNFGRLEIIAQTINGNKQSAGMTFSIRRMKLENLRIRSITDYQWKEYFVNLDGTESQLQVEGIPVNDMPVYKNKKNQGIKLGYMVNFSIDSIGLSGPDDEIEIDAAFAAADGMDNLYYADIYVQNANGEYELLEVSDYANDSSKLKLNQNNRRAYELEPTITNRNTWDFSFFIPPTAKVVKRGDNLNLYSDNTYKDKLLIMFDITVKKASGGTYNYTERETLWGTGNGDSYGSNFPSGLDLLNKGINHGEVFWYNLKETSLDDLLVQREW